MSHRTHGPSRVREVCHDAEEARDLGDFRSAAKLGEKLEDAPGCGGGQETARRRARSTTSRGDELIRRLLRA